jgi:VanZ family protein
VNRKDKHTSDQAQRKQCISWIAVICMGVLIFWMSANTGSTINEGLGIISSIKALLADAALALFGHAVDVSPVGHFVEYFIFGILLCNALRFSVPLPRAIFFALILGSAYGVTDEIHHRSCDPLDWLVDTVAVFLGASLFSLIKRKSAKDLSSKGAR